MIELWGPTAMVAVFVAAVVFWPLFLTRARRPKPRRCKAWVPLSYVHLWPDEAAEDPPHVQCKLPAGHQPRDQHLIDPDEVCQLRLFKAPF